MLSGHNVNCQFGSGFTASSKWIQSRVTSPFQLKARLSAQRIRQIDLESSQALYYLNLHRTTIFTPLQDRAIALIDDGSRLVAASLIPAVLYINWHGLLALTRRYQKSNFA